MSIPFDCAHDSPIEYHGHLCAEDKLREALRLTGVERRTSLPN